MTMIPLDGRAESALDHHALFQVLGGDIAAIDPWTRVDFSWMHAGAASARDVVGYRGLTMPFRVAGLTLGDADAAPSCDAFLVEIAEDRLVAQLCVRPEPVRLRHDAATLAHWAAGSLSKHLRVLHFDDGDLGLQAELHLSAATPEAAVREFVTAFSWDVAALQATDTDGALLTTEEWIRRATLSISRATPLIPLRTRYADVAWPAFESPGGVFCSLQPCGGLAESDNVLYRLRSDAALLEPVAALPGHRADWDVSRLTDVWLSRSGTAMIARSLLCEGYVRGTGDARWTPLDCDAITAVAPHGQHGFLLGLHDGHVAVFDGEARAIAAQQRIAPVMGRFSHLISACGYAAGLIGTTVYGARLAGTNGGRAARWSTRLARHLTLDSVADMDVDCVGASPVLAVLGDDGLVLLDAATGALKSDRLAVQGRLARWIGPDC